MLLSKEGQEQPGRLRFGLALWFGICILAYSFLPMTPEAANAAESGGGVEAAINGPPNEEYQLLMQLPIILLPTDAQMYEAKAEARLQLVERAEAAALAEEQAKAEAEAKAQAAAAQYDGRELAVPTSRQANSGFKSFMDYRALQNRRSSQYILQQDAATDEQGFRVYDGCYMVALGTYYAKSVGERFRITLESGESFMAITGDIKSDAHTDPLHQHRNGNIVEFIVDTTKISAQCRRMGDMSYAGFSGRIKSIEKLD